MGEIRWELVEIRDFIDGDTALGFDEAGIPSKITLYPKAADPGTPTVCTVSDTYVLDLADVSSGNPNFTSWNISNSEEVTDVLDGTFTPGCDIHVVQIEGIASKAPEVISLVNTGTTEFNMLVHHVDKASQTPAIILRPGTQKIAAGGIRSEFLRDDILIIVLQANSSDEPISFRAAHEPV